MRSLSHQPRIQGRDLVGCGPISKENRKEKTMHSTYEWVKARQDDRLREALAKQELNKLRPARRSIVSLLRARFDSLAVPDVLHEPVHDARTTA
jgi:hypothetical protein